MKKIFFIISLLAMICGNLKGQLWGDNVATSFASGDGSENNPFIITTPQQLAYLSNLNFWGNVGSNNFFELGATIDLRGDWNIPIGTTAYPFLGKFDGKGYHILNLQYGYNMVNHWGLFGYTGEGAVIKNVRIDGGSVAVTSGALTDRRAGSLIVFASGTTVESCSVNNFYIVTNAGRVGGLIAEAVAGTTVKNCSFSGTIINSASGALNSTGGLVGRCQGATFENCFSELMLQGGGNSGGFIGQIITSGNNIIRNCYTICKMNATSSYSNLIGFGGFIGTIDWNAEVEISDCRVSGLVSGSNNVGGFIGYTASGNKGKITGCISEADVSGTNDNAGGFIGYSNYSTEISYCRSTGSTNGYNCVGGFFGTAEFAVTHFCYAEGPVSGYSMVGGFVGNSRCPLSQCFSYGNVEGFTKIGGFVGETFESFTDCFAAGFVKGYENIGGFVGYSYWDRDNEISNCYAVGSVEGNINVGGFAGIIVDYMSFYTVNVNNCFVGGTVFCDNSESSGAFFGNAISTFSSVIDIELCDFSNCYFNRQTSGIVRASGTPNITDILALSASEMTNNLPAGFLQSEWLFKQGFYPQLKSFAECDNEAIRLLSALSVAPLIPNGEETTGDIKSIIQLAKKTPSGHDIEWTVDPAENATVANYGLYTKKYDAWRTLKVRSGAAERKIMFRSVSDLMTTDISVKINNKLYGNISSTFTYTDACKSKEESVFAEITIGGYAIATPATSMSLYANQPHKVTVTTEDGQSKTYTFEIPISADIFVQRWNDVLAINNNFTTNGGYNFVDYEWYKDGAKMSSDKGYIQEPKGLDKTAKYTAKLTTQQGNKLNTCPAELSDAKSTMAVYPNPVQRGQIVKIETEIGKGVIQLFDVAGNIISKQTMQNPLAELIAPDTLGTYILQITENGKSQSIKIVVE